MHVSLLPPSCILNCDDASSFCSSSPASPSASASSSSSSSDLTQIIDVVPASSSSSSAADAKSTQDDQEKPSVYVLGSDFSARMTQEEYLVCLRALMDEKQRGIASSSLTCHASSFDGVQLGAGATAMMNAPNAGGNSDKSEALSFELMSRLFGAKLVKTEMDIEYAWCISKKTDYSCRMFGHLFGVSVTRAFKYKGEYTLRDAQTLLKKKLFGVVASSRDVLEHDAWGKQLLHVWAPDHKTAQLLREAYATMDDELLSNTLVLITVCDARWIYTNY